MRGLVCPSCRHDVSYLHHGRVEVFERPEDAEDVSRTTVEGWRTVCERVSNDRSGNPSRRRHGLCVHFECELCSAKPVLQIAQHKGQTLVGWGTHPEAAVEFGD